MRLSMTIRQPCPARGRTSVVTVSPAVISMVASQRASEDEPSLSLARTRSLTGPLVAHGPVSARGKALPQQREQDAGIAEPPLGDDPAVRRLELDVGEGALGEEASEVLVDDEEARLLVCSHPGASGYSAALAFAFASEHRSDDGG
jgi:hypothetical protein